MTDDRPVFYYAQGTSWLFNMLGVTITMGMQLAHLNLFGIDLVSNPTPPTATGYVKGINNDFYYWDGQIPNDPFPNLLPSSLWKVKRVPYPASTIFIGPSIEWAVDWIIADILTTPVGTPFACGGYSQGAAVMSRIYQECRQGRLANRRADLRAVVAFGNPMREQGHGFPGHSGYSGALDIAGDTISGHGVFPDINSLGIFDPFIQRFARLQGTEPLFWDFTMPNEVIGGVGDSQDGQEILNFTREGLRVFPIWTLLNLGAFGKMAALGVAPPGVEQQNGLIKITDPKTGAVSYAPGGGHVMYPHFPPPNRDGSIPTSGDTCYQLAARYLTTVGQRIYDERHPTVPAPTNPISYQWFSSLPGE